MRRKAQSLFAVLASRVVEITVPTVTLCTWFAIMNLPEVLLRAERAICTDHARTGIVAMSGSPVFTQVKEGKIFSTSR